MRRTSVTDMNCSVAQCLEVIGDWWTMLIIRDVFLGARRFDEIQERLGVSRNVLTSRLDQLIADDILERRPYQDKPPRYEYMLTERGLALWPVLTAMRQWGDTWAAPGGPPVEVVHRQCGKRTVVQYTCSECGEEIHDHDLKAVPGPAHDESGPLPAKLLPH